ncbi:DNA gyrase [Paraeggerthella hongkongensis]|uniref:DNA gyrase n=1 Tax=Paraeggerthella hongkongensis TaxID=230658 RepID=A0A3N0BDX7_9ACTN|nr:DNA gyrase [Paraeggerthella hongkongensis]RNL46015.1 DNA gyrase [Paraeggerthella hongkongensis]
MTEKKNVYLTLHKNFVRTDIEYEDKVTGETKTFNQVTLPKGTVIDSIDVGSYQFSPLFANESKYRGENFRDIPLLADREVWLKRTILDADGQPVLDESGKPEKDTVKVMPQEIKEAVERQRSEYLAEHAKDSKDKGRQDLGSKVAEARDGSQALGARGDAARSRENARA